MKDIQLTKDTRGIDLDKVGIRDLKLPILILDGDISFNTVANIELSVDLHRDFKGTHMSRFIETINKYNKINPLDTEEILDNLIGKLNSKNAYLSMEFSYFLNKKSPVTKIDSIMDVECIVKSKKVNNNYNNEIILKVPVATLCPCSKAISEYGAHNQRAIVSVKIKSLKNILLKDVIDIIESCASTPLYPLVKRIDEKFVTESAFSNPKFVEDIARDVYIKLKDLDKDLCFEIDVESYESIHNHNAFSYVISEGSGEE